VCSCRCRHLLAIHLADGTVRKSEPLPDIFPPSLAACQHSLTADGAWHAYVSVVDPSSILPHLVVGRLTFTWPDLHEFVVLLNVAVSSLHLGAAIPYAASSAVSTTTLWYALSQGLVGIDPSNSTLGVTRSLPLPVDVTFSGLQYDRNGARPIVGVLRNATGAVLASFVDTGPTTPVLVREGLFNDYPGHDLHTHIHTYTRTHIHTYTRTHVYTHFLFVYAQSAVCFFLSVHDCRQEWGTTALTLSVASRGTWTALMNDRNRIAMITSSGQLATVDLNGTVLTTLPICNVTDRDLLQTGAGCPVCMAYEPYVF
jgi:hypothetical protein